PMRVIFTLLLAVLWCGSIGQAVFFSNPGGGAWNSPATWTCVDNCDDAGSIPGANDIAVITDARVDITANASVGNLFVVSNVPECIGKGGFGSPILTINGQLSGAEPGLSGALEPPSVNVFHSSTSSLTLRFTGSSAFGPVITEWGHNAPIQRVNLDPGASNSLNVDSFTFQTALTISRDRKSVV